MTTAEHPDPHVEEVQVLRHIQQFVGENEHEIIGALDLDADGIDATVRQQYLVPKLDVAVHHTEDS